MNDNTTALLNLIDEIDDLAVRATFNLLLDTIAALETRIEVLENVRANSSADRCNQCGHELEANGTCVVDHEAAYKAPATKSDLTDQFAAHIVAEPDGVIAQLFRASGVAPNGVEMARLLALTASPWQVRYRPDLTDNTYEVWRDESVHESYTVDVLSDKSYMCGCNKPSCKHIKAAHAFIVQRETARAKSRALLTPEELQQIDAPAPTTTHHLHVNLTDFDYEVLASLEVSPAQRRRMTYDKLVSCGKLLACEYADISTTGNYCITHQGHFALEARKPLPEVEPTSATKPVKLTPAQRGVLTALVRGIRFRQHNSRQSGWYNSESGSHLLKATIQPLFDAGLVSEDRVEDFYRLTITDLGRAALNAAKGD